jgi:FtsZ-interacting cell division protein ZipA
MLMVPNMDTNTVWIIVAVVVIIAVVVAALLFSRRRNTELARRRATDLRDKAQADELAASQREAQAARAQADAKEAEIAAERLRREATEHENTASEVRARAAEQARKADELDPGVQHGEHSRHSARGAGEPVVADDDDIVADTDVDDEPVAEPRPARGPAVDFGDDADRRR